MLPNLAQPNFRFSPLFFGVYGDTSHRRSVHGVKIVFQSPIFRGLWWYLFCIRAVM